MITRRAAFLSLPLVAGCATIEGWLNNPVIAASLEDAINLAVGIVLQSLGGNALQVAQEIAADITGIISAATGTTVTLATLEASADKLIADSNLSSLAKSSLEEIIAIAVSALSTGTAVAASSSGPLATPFDQVQKSLSLYLVASKTPRGNAVLMRLRK